MNSVHKCPVCSGHGVVIETLYTRQAMTTRSPCDVPCKSCYGRGVIIVQGNEPAVDQPNPLKLIVNPSPPESPGERMKRMIEMGERRGSLSISVSAEDNIGITTMNGCDLVQPNEHSHVTVRGYAHGRNTLVEGE